MPTLYIHYTRNVNALIGLIINETKETRINENNKNKPIVKARNELNGGYQCQWGMGAVCAIACARVDGPS